MKTRIYAAPAVKGLPHEQLRSWLKTNEIGLHTCTRHTFADEEDFPVA